MKRRDGSQRLRRLKDRVQRYWLPLVLGFVATIAVLGLWQQLVIEEHRHIEQLVQQQVNLIQVELEKDLTAHVSTLERMAKRWDVGGGTSKNVWETSAASNIEDFPGLQAIAWVDSLFQMKWIVPQDANNLFQDFNLRQASYFQAILNEARDLRQLRLTPSILFPNGEKGFLAVAPLFVEAQADGTGRDRFDGFLLGFFPSKTLFDSILPPASQYQVQISDNTGLIYQQGKILPSTLAKRVLLQAYGREWQVQIALTSLIRKERSLLPTLILGGGVAGAWIIALVVYLGQRSEQYVRQVRKANQQLHQEILERQNIETKLRSRETSIRNLTARLELAVQSAGIGIWEWDIINNSLIWDDQMYRLYGLNPDNFIGVYEAWESAIHPNDRELAIATSQQARRGETNYEPEFRIVHSDGTVRYIQAYGVIQRDAQGEAQRMIGANFDITDRKQFELVLKESEAKYRQLINHMNVGFVVHAPDTHILQCNETACELLGLSMEQMLGKEAIDPTWHFLREDGTVMPVEEYPVHRVLSTQVPLENYVVGLHRGTQSQAWVLVTAFPEFDTNNQLKQIVVTFIDISQLKQAETELREMADVMENAISGISKLDAEGRYLYVNKAYADITGYRPEEMIGMSWQRTVHPDGLAPLNIAYQQMLQDSKVEVEAKGIRQDSSSFYKQLVMISAYDQQQQFVGHYCFMKDISDRKAIEEELQQSESTLRSFFNNEAMLMGIVELHDHDIFHLADNQTTASFFGITSEAMKNRFASEMGVSRPQLEQWIQAYQEAARTQSPVHFEYSHETPSGQFWLAATVCQIDNHANHYPRFSYIVEDITERKQTELALENELMRSQMLFNISIDGIVVVNHQGDIVKTSPSFARMLGYTVEETLQLNLADWDAQWTREELQQILRQSIELPPVFETRHRRKDGSVYDVEISYSRVEIDGEMMHFCICRDISERKCSEAEHKQAEIALQNSQARFAGILEIASDAIVSVNGEQQITLFNKGAERIFGYTAEEVLGQPLALLLPDRFAQAHCHHVKEYAHSGSQTRQMAQRGAIFGRRKDGTEFPAEASISRLTLDGETIFTTFLRDVTERQQAELALQESEQRFQAFMQNAPLLAWIADTEGRLLYANATFFDFIGSTPMTAIGKPIKALFPEKLAQRCLHNTQLVLETGTVVETIEDVSAPDGSRRECLVRKFPIQRHDQTIWVGGVAFDITEQRQAEEALRQSEATKQAIIAAIPDLLIRMRADGSYVDFISDSRFNIINPAHVRQDAHVYDILPPDLAQLRLDYSQQALASGITQIYEQGIVIEGQQRYEEVRIVALLQDEVLIMVRDITDRKQAEEELCHQKEMFQVIVDNIPVMIALFNNQGRIDFINPEFERTLGWSLEEWQQRDVMVDLYPDPLYLQGVLDHMTAAMGNWKDFTTLTATQQQIETSWTNVPISKGRFLGIGQDITDRKQSEIALQESAVREQAIAEVLRQMRQSLSLETIFATTTQELRRVLNCDRVLVYRFNTDWSGAVVAESVGSGWISVIETLIHQDASFDAHTSEQDRCIIKRWDSREAETKDTYIQETQGSVYSQGTRYLAVNDIYQSGFEECYVEFLEKFQVRAYLTVPIFSNNKLWGLLASYQNSELREWRDSEVQVASQIVAQLGIAVHQAELFAQIQRQSKELRQAMEAAEAANLAKSMFLANMSHELRTPLNVILGFAQIMSHDASLTSNQRDDLQTIQRSSDHLLSLINDVLDLSKIEAGHYTLEESGFDLISLLHTLRTMMVERANAKQLQLTFEIAPDVPQFVIADEQKLRQVLLNLLSNAVKFTKQGSVTLRVTSWESSEKTCLVPNASPHVNSLKHSLSSAACTLQFEVADTGVGIAQTEHEAIFDAFTQAEAGRKAVGGTGLGLTISRKLLELMDGSISVESYPGDGSTFTVRVPVCPTSSVDGQVEHQEKTIIGLVSGQPHRRILVVDDQPENRLLIVRLLTRLGLEVKEAINGQEAIALWQQWKPDLTWMDIRMPDLDGYEATKQIRAMEHEQASSIIALTAQASQSDRALALAAGCNDYISKPFREETLFLKLKEYLGLEYLYAEASDLSNSPSISTLDIKVDPLTSFDPAMLAQVPIDLLETLEDLALCGNDRAIVDMANQLVPEFDDFKMQLLDLANRFEFEQIVYLIRRDSSS